MNLPSGAGGSSPLGSWVSTLPSPLLPSPGGYCSVSNSSAWGRERSGWIIPRSYPRKKAPEVGTLILKWDSPLPRYGDWVQVSNEQTQEKLQLFRSTCPCAEYSGTGISL